MRNVKFDIHYSTAGSERENGGDYVPEITREIHCDNGVSFIQ